MKKLLISCGAIAAVLVIMPMFAAFEAHVVNVTATIENALSVPTTLITFGTVFPQEHLNKPLTIALSQSFINESRVNSVDYVIRQKPKCAWSWEVNGVWNIDENSTKTGEVIVGDDSKTQNITEAYWINCGPPPAVTEVQQGVWGVLPSLCEYISKDSPKVTDVSIPSFHHPFTVSNGIVNWLDAKGHLSKAAGDSSTQWTIDLAVPCFGGFCAQDWASFVHRINPNADPAVYTQPIGNEHKVFGCDLWVEVNGVDASRQEVTLQDKHQNPNDPTGPWIENNTPNLYGTLNFAKSGATFDYSFYGYGLTSSTSYSLIYYADPYPGNNPGAFIGSGMTLADGTLTLSGNPNLGISLPTSPDANFATGAKVWLVPSSDYDIVAKKMIGPWSPNNYLFETVFIHYTKI